jgi:hypothetical protein
LSPDEEFSTLAFTLNPDRNSVLVGELGRKWGGELTDKESSAYSIGYTTRLRNTAVFNISHNTRGVIYAGSMVGTENTSSSLNVPINKELNASLMYSTSKQKPIILTGDVSAAKSENAQIKLSYRMNENRDIFIAAGDNQRNDWINNRYDEREKVLQAGISQSLRNLRFNYTLNRNRWHDSIQQLGRWYTLHNLSSVYYGQNNMIVSGYLNFSRFGNDQYLTQPDNNSYGLAADWGILENLRMRLNYSESRSIRSDGRSSNLGLKFSYTYEYTNVDFGVNRSRGAGLNNVPLYYELSISQQFGIPVSRNIKIGALTGVVTELVGSDSAAVPNVALLINNLAAITDAKGRYVFADMRPGTYTLDIDRRAASISKISSTGLPVSVYIAGGKLAVLDLQLQEGCRLSGEVKVQEKLQDGPATLDNVLANRILAPLPTGARKIVGERLAGVIIDIRKDDKFHTCMTDSMGRFVFPGVESGVWNYKVIQSSIPEGYQIDRTEGIVNLSPESEQKIGFTVSEVERVIEMVGSD